MMYSDIKDARLITKPNFEVKLLFLNALSFPPSSGSGGKWCHFVGAYI